MRLFVLALTALVLTACADDDENPDRCGSICPPFEACGVSCACSPGAFTSCANETEILDALEACANRPCNEQMTCVQGLPTCQ